MIQFDKQQRDTLTAALTYYLRHGMDEPANRPEWLQKLACPTDDDTSLDRIGIERLLDKLQYGYDESWPKYIASVQFDYRPCASQDGSYIVTDPAGNTIAHVPNEEWAAKIADGFNGGKTALMPPVKQWSNGKHNYRVSADGSGFDILDPGSTRVAGAPHHIAAAQLCAALDQYAAGNKPCSTIEVGRWLNTNKANIAVATSKDVEAITRCVYAEQDDKLLIITEALPPRDATAATNI